MNTQTDDSITTPAVAHHATPAHAWVVMGVALLAMSSGAIFARLAQEAPALTRAAWRVGLAAAFVLPVALWYNAAELRRLTRAQWLLASLSGAFLALHFTVWISSLDDTSVASSTLLVNTAPLWVALLAPWITGDRLHARGWLGMALSLGGVAVAGAGEYSISARACRGDLLALLGGFFVALYLMLGRRLRREVSLLPYLAATYTVSALLLWTMVVLSRSRAVGFHYATWGGFFGMALVAQHLGHSGRNYALRFLSPGVLSVLSLSEPIISGLAAWICFGEVPSAWLRLAAALLLPGIWLVVNDTQNSSR